MPKRLLIAVAFVFALSSLGAGRAGEDVLTFLDGRQSKGVITHITADGQVTLAGTQTPVALLSLRHIARSVKPSAAEVPSAQVYWVGGGVSRATAISIQKSACVMDWAGGKAWSLSLKHVRGLYLLPEDEKHKTARAAFDRALTSKGEEADRVLAVGKENIITVRGVVLAMDKAHLTVEYRGKARKVARDKLVGVVLAATQTPPDHTGHVCVYLRDGSRLWGAAPSLQDEVLAFAAEPEREVRLAWPEVTRLVIRSDRMRFLSDLQPTAVVEQALVTFAGPYQRDRNVLGKPLRLGKRTYEKGLGVHARCLLTYETADQYATLAADIGIDAGAEGAGDCLFVVLGDGRELFKKRMRGQDKPCPLRLSIKGVRRLTLAVEPGENLDLGDNADWCDARLLK